jgi:hypothetical protein
MPEEFIITKDGDKDVKNTNPTHENWVALDQQVISFLLSSIEFFSSKSALAKVCGYYMEHHRACNTPCL